MRTIETKVYSFSELSNEAKEKAIEKYYENENYPFLSDDLTESCKEYFKENELLGLSDDPRKTYIEEIMPAKIQLNMKYIQHPGLLNDIKIMWRTFLKIVH